MKNIYKILIAFVGVLAVSCNADAVDERPVLDAVATPEITAPSNGQSFVLDVDKGSEEAAKFTWSAADYSKDVVVKYTLLVDKKGGDFSAAKTLATTTSITEASILGKNLNQAAIDLGGKPEVAALYDVKITANVAGSFSQVGKNVITISITPYLGRVTYDFTDWYLIGAAVAGGWDNNVDTNHQPMFRDGKEANKYKFVGYFKAGNFKLISEKGSWASQLGKASDTSIEIKDNAGEFTIPADGYYTFEFNTTTLKYTLKAYAAGATAPIYDNSKVGIIGDATEKGWDASTPMAQSTFNAHAWTLGATSLNDGGMKFRANNAWDVSWGGTTAFSGGGTGDNIPVAKSKYVIYFNDLDGSYLMIPNQ
ncbi:SusE domain-containing protein [Flavobacterium tistrianum]|uniref:SusE domain-containing protein n=1 Tax=Flavobacterium tistrianum TaxID=1685414 RepID=UPI000DACAC20|nr:SusE domain-containing protein [Flavobacterium tistrianum]KAF2339870.1 SusF/SusE family outer membrane protein [Flavobacterium tistrianum]